MTEEEQDRERRATLLRRRRQRERERGSRRSRIEIPGHPPAPYAPADGDIRGFLMDRDDRPPFGRSRRGREALRERIDERIERRWLSDEDLPDAGEAAERAGDEGGDNAVGGGDNANAAGPARRAPPPRARERENAAAGGDEGARMPRHVQRALWRLLVGDPARLGPEPSTHEELIESLRRARVLSPDGGVAKAMALIPRGDFVPEGQQSEAYLDCPLAIPQLGFNISAPHIHATCLEKLKLEPGHDFLDVGCGCGLVTCLGAYLVGKSGTSVGIEINSAALNVSRRNARTFRAKSQDFAREACEVSFEKRNAFLPDPKLRLFDRINVAGSCPPSKVKNLLSMLKDEGKLIVPCGSDLQLYTKFFSVVTMEVVSHVRFGELVVPSDAEIVVRTLQLDKEREISRLLGESFPNAGGSGPTGMEEELGMEAGSAANAAPATIKTNTSIDYDSLLIGKRIPDGIPVHKKVLEEQCLLFQTQFSSGMRDARSCEFVLPEQFSFGTSKLLVDWLYRRGTFAPPDPATRRTQMWAPVGAATHEATPPRTTTTTTAAAAAGAGAASAMDLSEENGGKKAEGGEVSGSGASGAAAAASNHPLAKVPIQSVVELLELSAYVDCRSLGRCVEKRLCDLICDDNCQDLLAVADGLAGSAPCLQQECLDFIIMSESCDMKQMEPHLVTQIAERASSKFRKVMQLLDKDNAPTITTSNDTNNNA